VEALREVFLTREWRCVGVCAVSSGAAWISLPSYGGNLCCLQKMDNPLSAFPLQMLQVTGYLWQHTSLHLQTLLFGKFCSDTASLKARRQICHKDSADNLRRCFLES